MGVRHSTNIEEAENGHIVRVSHDEEGQNGKPGKYMSKTFVAKSLPEAQKIAANAFGGKKMNGYGDQQSAETNAVQAPEPAKGAPKLSQKPAGRKRMRGVKKIAVKGASGLKSAPMKRG